MAGARIVPAMHSLVTGANGHLGTALVQALLARGDRVRASVRSLGDARKTAHLHALGDVELVEADVMDARQLRAAMDGIDVLYHAAAVYSTVENARADEIVQVSRVGVEHAMRAAADARVRKVVLTSSVVTLPLRAPGQPPATEDDWTTDLRVPYVRAKSEGERRAWELARSLGVDLVAILPSGIFGAGFRRNTPSIDLVEAMMKGLFTLGVPRANFTLTDVRDVARAHLMAQAHDARGRFIVCAAMLTFAEILELVRRANPSTPRALMQVPTVLAPWLTLFDHLGHRLLGTPRIATPEAIATGVSGTFWHVSSDRARRELGWSPQVPIDQSIRETVEALRQRMGGA